MAYYTRVLAEKKDIITVSQIRDWLQREGLKIGVMVEDGDADSWRQITLKRTRGKELVTIERNLVEPGSLGEAEIQEFLEELTEAKPKSAANWLIEYLPNIKVVYAFQILFTGNRNEDWQLIQIIKDKIWNALGGIIQADYEGFSNREGYHILWQFSDNVKGTWNMTVVSDTGKWQTFQMDLGNKQHRSAFLEGKVPEGVSVISQ
ncbi:MAG: hypothetical protein HY782_29165 [Chloroflexi bacterium]|nr:hypothetical protein [Chloroflexota bacterium]